jgi:cation transport regulator ChaB
MSEPTGDEETTQQEFEDTIDDPQDDEEADDDDAPGETDDDACDPRETHDDGASHGASEDGVDYKNVTVRRGDQSDRIEAQLPAWEKAVRTDAKANGGVVPPETSGRSLKHVIRFKQVPAAAPQPLDTESELNALIAECRFLVHEVAFNSARLTYDPDDRIRFLGSAESLAITATKVADAIGRLRSAGQPQPQAIDLHRHELVYTHVQTSPSPRPAESENQ